MKASILSLLIAALVSACNTALLADADTLLKAGSAVESMAEHAIQQKDFRLLATAGRRSALPGIDPQEQALAMQDCGSRLLENSGDVITHDNAEERRQLIDAAKRYNQLIWQACQQQKGL